MSKLLSQGNYGCIYYPGMKCDGNTDKNKKYVTKLQRLDNSADTEIIISNKIKKIKKYSKFFLPVEKYCSVNLSKLDSKTLEPCEIVARYTTNDYILMYIKYVKSKPLMEYILGNSKTTSQIQYKERIYRTISTYKQILIGLTKLNNKNIVHFDLHGNNIICSDKTGYPYIIDFGMAFVLNDVNIHNIRNIFFTPAPEYYTYPLEVHFINMLISQDITQIELTDIYNLCNTFVSNNRALNMFSKEFKILYYKTCINYLKQYLGKDRMKTAFKLLKYAKSWNNYSLSIINLQLLDNLYNNTTQNNNFNMIMVQFTQLLVQNIHPDPKKRYSIKKSREVFNNIFITNPKADYKHMFNA